MELNGFGYTPSSNDIDCVADSAQIVRLENFLRGSKFSRHGNPNLYVGGEHRRFQFRPEQHPDIVIDLDVYFGRLRFNHLVPLPYFDDDSRYTLPITQLLLSKLAIVEISSHDVLGVCSILAEHEIGDTADVEMLQKPLLRRVWCRGFSGWRIAKTCLENIKTIRHQISEMPGLADSTRRTVRTRLDELESSIDHCQKSLSWRIRGVIGTSFLGMKIPWYYDVHPPESSGVQGSVNCQQLTENRAVIRF
jgi:hypothetical protein